MTQFCVFLTGGTQAASAKQVVVAEVQGLHRHQQLPSMAKENRVQPKQVQPRQTGTVTMITRTGTGTQQHLYKDRPNQRVTLVSFVGIMQKLKQSLKEISKNSF